MVDKSFHNNNASRLRQRLWGATVLIAIAVIVLPLILDGAGTESQFRQVERLREEPPASAKPTILVSAERAVSSIPPETSQTEAVVAVSNRTVAVESEMAQAPSVAEPLPLTAWAVQAAAFVQETDAVQLRDQLRRAGFASFVRDRNQDTDPFRVLVGPMIKQESAEKARARVAALLQNDPFIVNYP